MFNSYKRLTLTIALISLTACSVNKAPETVLNVNNSKQVINESAPVKLNNISPKHRATSKNKNQPIYKVISKPLSVNKTMTEVYLLQLKALELVITNLEKVN